MYISSVICSFLAIGAIGAPILSSGSGGLPIDTSEVSNLITEVESTTGLVNGLPVHDLGLPSSTGEITKVANEVESLADVGGAGLFHKRSLLNLSGILGTINDVLTLVGTVETNLTSLLQSDDVQNLDVEGILSSVEDLLSQILDKVNALLSDARLGLDLSDVEPTLSALTTQVNGIANIVQSLADEGVTCPALDDVKSLLSQILGLLSSY